MVAAVDGCAAITPLSPELVNVVLWAHGELTGERLKGAKDHETRLRILRAAKEDAAAFLAQARARIEVDTDDVSVLMCEAAVADMNIALADETGDGVQAARRAALRAIGRVCDLFDPMDSIRQQTPEFAELKLVWRIKLRDAEIAAATDGVGRQAAAKTHLEAAVEGRERFYKRFVCFENSADLTLCPIIEYAAAEAEHARGRLSSDPLPAAHPGAASAGPALPRGVVNTMREGLPAARVITCARKEVDGLVTACGYNRVSPELAVLTVTWSKRLRAAEMDAATRPDQMRAAAAAHLGRMRELHGQIVKRLGVDAVEAARDVIAYAVAEAEYAVARESSPASQPATGRSH